MRLISLDIGTVRTGYAFGDPELAIAFTRPEILLTTDLIKFLLTEFSLAEFNQILVGYPTNRNSQNTLITDFVDQTLKEISINFPLLETIKVNERYSSQSAFSNLAGNRKTKNQKIYLDNEAARILLQAWFDRKIN